MKKSGRPLTAPPDPNIRMSRRAAISIFFAGEISHIHAQAFPWAAPSEAGSTALEQGRKKEAERQFELALDQARRSNADDLIIAQCLDNLATAAYYARNLKDRDRQREKLYRESLAIRERRLGTDHPEIARSLARVAGALWDFRQGE